MTLELLPVFHVLLERLRGVSGKLLVAPAVVEPEEEHIELWRWNLN
jgi:hypothetical protein